MDLWETYSAAFDAYKAKKFDTALELVDTIKKSAPELKKIHMLEAWIYSEQNEYLKALIVLEKLLLQFDARSPDEKPLLAQSLNHMGLTCDRLALTTEALKFYRLAAKTYEENRYVLSSMSNAVYVANAIENFSAAEFDELYAEYKSYLADVVPYQKKFYSHEKIRVGFLSADFRGHPAMNWGLALVTGLDKDLFSTHFYSASQAADFVTEKILPTADLWRDISNLTDAQAAELIRGDEIDILLDLSGHSNGNRLGVAVYRPASVQVSGIGYIGSTGLDAVDYFISDVHCAGNDAFFVEKLIRLPHSHFCYTPLVTAPINPVKKDFVTFGCFNQFGKVTDLILSAWAKILDAVPASRLLFKHKIFDTESGRQFVGDRLKNFGIDTARVDMRGFTANHLRDYNDVDIALDTFPYVGGVTTCEALYMGVPVVSLYGSRHGTRFGLSMLRNVGLEELAVDNIDDYINRAVMLAGDRELLNILRKNLRGMMKRSPLMDATAYVRDMQEALIKILHDKKIASRS